MRLTLSLMSRFPKNYSYSNFPERYIRKQTQFKEWQTPPYENYQPRIVRYRNRPYYDLHRPWTTDFQDMNAPNIKHPRIFVEPIKDWPIFVGDYVQVLTGRDAGKKGTVDYIVQERNWVLVKGLNLDYKMSQKDAQYPGVLHSSRKPLLYPRDVKLVDPEDSQPTDIEWRYDEEGERVRVCIRTGRIIPMPKKAFETRDFTDKSVYKEQPKDTLPEEAEKATFMPEIKTFEMDIMEKKGIKDDRVPYPMYWY